MIEKSEDSFNVMILSLLIVLVVLAVSVVILWFYTKDAYLDSYFVLDAFLDAQNTAASSQLAEFAFSTGGLALAVIFLIVIVDNLSRILITSFILAAVIDFISYANIEESLNEFRAKLLKKHVIICGYNDLADVLIRMLRRRRMRFVVLVQSVDVGKKLNAEHVHNLVLDFTEERSLRLAGISKASSIVFVSESDSDNTIGALLAKKLNPSIRILSRLKDEHARRKIYIAGADMAVIPEYLAGLEIGDYIRRAIKAGAL
ncbi:MAG: NAD-binding protein [Candidatus Micrarchaeia archaeon]